LEITGVNQGIVNRANTYGNADLPAGRQVF